MFLLLILQSYTLKVPDHLPNLCCYAAINEEPNVRPCLFASKMEHKVYCFKYCPWEDCFLL